MNEVKIHPHTFNIILNIVYTKVYVNMLSQVHLGFKTMSETVPRVAYNVQRPDREC